MITKDFTNDFNSPIRKITGKAELYGGSAATSSDKEIVKLENVVSNKKAKVNTSSKNLLNMDDWVKKGVADKAEDGSYYTSCAKMYNAYGPDSGSGLYKPTNGNNRITIRGSVKTTAADASSYCFIVMISYTDGTSTRLNWTGKFTNGVSDWETVTKTSDANKTIEKVYVSWNTIYVYVKDFQIEIGTTATPYTPYIESGSNTEIMVRGKNLFDTSKLLTECGWVEENGYLVGTADSANTKFGVKTDGIMSLEGIDTVSMSFRGYIPVEGRSGLYFAVVYDDDSRESIGVLNTTTETYSARSLNLNKDSNKKPKKLCLTYSNYSGICYIKDIQLEIGTAATEYEPYVEPTYYTATLGEEIEVTPYAPTTTISAIGCNIQADYTKDTLLNTFSHTDNLKDIEIDRIGEEGKFFGFDITHKATINILDKNRAFNIDKDNYFKLYFNINENEYVNNSPILYVADTKRDENTNALTITAEDALLSAAGGITVAEMGLSAYTIRDFAKACARMLGLQLSLRGFDNEACFDIDYPEGANFEGTETVREAIKAIAEATQSVAYLTADSLVFRRLGAAAADLVIEKQHYFTLKNNGEQTLGGVCHATSLGDNVSSPLTSGAIQYVRDNPFWEMREDITTLVENAAAAITGLSINQFECKWRGNFLLELGDRIDIITKDGGTLTSYLLDDTITYNGGYKETSTWSHKKEEETPSNPSTLGEVIKQTYAKVDKVNKEITLVASEVDANTEDVSSLLINTKSITASVSRIEDDLKNNQQTTNEEISNLKTKVEAQITPEDVTIAIQTELSNGVDKVETSTGYKFDKDGLNVSKSGSNTTTTISEDGMKVKRNSEEVLTANSEGVVAVDLRAKTYLIIGETSRFEDWGGRTACFWIGGK